MRGPLGAEALALQCLWSMEQRELQANIVTFNSTMSGCAKAKDRLRSAFEHWVSEEM